MNPFTGLSIYRYDGTKECCENFERIIDAALGDPTVVEFYNPQIRNQERYDQLWVRMSGADLPELIIDKGDYLVISPYDANMLDIEEPWEIAYHGAGFMLVLKESQFLELKDACNNA